MTCKRVRNLLIAALLGSAPTLTPSPAQALPLPGSDQGVVVTYYSDSTRTKAVGWRHYGFCGEPYDIGVHSRYFDVEVFDCTRQVGTPNAPTPSSSVGQGDE